LMPWLCSVMITSLFSWLSILLPPY